MARIAVFGAGYVGVCTGVVFSQRGHEVRLVDVVRDKVEALSRGRLPFHEPGLREALSSALAAGKITATVEAGEALRMADFAFLCVGTPRRRDGSPELTYLRSAAREIGRTLRGRSGFLTVVVKSTVLPGTCETVVLPELEKASGLRRGDGFDVAANPEFLKEGSALADAEHPDRVIVGAAAASTADRVWTLYDEFPGPKVSVDCATAEMIKHAANAFLAAKVGLSNEVANLCERIGVDWYGVAQAIGHDARIGGQFLRAGVGFGGSCFPKDVEALARFARTRRAPSGLLDAVLAGNERQPLEVLHLLRREFRSLRAKRVALLGLAFKPDTDDVRETRALPIFRALRRQGAHVVCHDPKALENFRTLVPSVKTASTVEEALRGADACVVQTEWSEYRNLAPARFVAWMRTPVVVDGRRTFDPRTMAEAGVRYRAVGLGAPKP